MTASFIIFFRDVPVLFPTSIRWRENDSFFQRIANNCVSLFKTSVQYNIKIDTTQILKNRDYCTHCRHIACQAHQIVYYNLYSISAYFITEYRKRNMFYKSCYSYMITSIYWFISNLFLPFFPLKHMFLNYNSDCSTIIIYFAYTQVRLNVYE